MSSSVALRRSPKPGAFTAAACSVPRSLLTTSVASASPSTSSAMMRSGRAEPRDLLQDGQEVLHRRDLLLVDEDHGILEDDFHALGIGHEVRREIAAIELHALDDVERRLQRLGFFNRDHAVLADLLHGLGDDGADGLIAIGGDHADLRDHVARHGPRHLLDLGHHDLDGLVDAALQLHGVGARHHVLRAFAIDRLRQHGGRRGAVTGRVRRLARHLADHLRAHVLERIPEVDLFRHRDTILGDGGGAELLVEDDVASLRAEGDFDRVRQLVDSAQDGPAGVLAVNDLFCHVCLPVLLAVDDCEHFVLTQDEVLLAVDLDFLTRVLPEQDRVAVLHVRLLAAAIVPDLALPDGEHFAALGLLLGGIGHDDAANGLFAFLETLNDETVVKRSDFHVSSRSGRGIEAPIACVAGVRQD